jgi:hypothetical protein
MQLRFVYPEFWKVPTKLLLSDRARKQGCQMAIFLIRVNFGWSCNGRCWYRCFMDIWCMYVPILSPFSVIYGHLVYILCGNWVIFFPVLVYCAKKNLATLRGNDVSAAKKNKLYLIFGFRKKKILNLQKFVPRRKSISDLLASIHRRRSFA